MSREFEVICRCLSARLQDDDEAWLLERAEVLNWDAALRLAVRHGVESLVYLRLTQLPGTIVPAKAANLFRAAFYANASRARQVATEACELSALLQEVNVRAITLKGVAIAEAAYGDITMRPPGDIDLLVRRADIKAVRELLLARGYQTHVRPEEEAEFLDTQLGYEFLGTDFAVELHWSFIPRTLGIHLDVDGALANAEQTTIAGCEGWVLQFPDRLLFLCAHGAKHCWDSLKWICDIGGLIERTPAPDWDKVLERARKAESERILLLGLHLAADIVGTQLPDRIKVLIAADEEAISELGLLVTGTFLHERRDAIDHVARASFNLRIRESNRARLPYFAHLMRLAISPSERDEKEITLPRGLRFLYPVVRLARITRVHGSRAIRGLSEVVRSTFSR